MIEFIPNPLIIPAGLLIGVLVAAPVGPVNVLCVQRAIEHGFLGGIAAGLGAVLGDGFIALGAALGVGQITGAIQHHRAIIQLVGGLALIGFAAKLYFAKPALKINAAGEFGKAHLGDFAWDIVQTFFMTVTNPGAVLGLIAIFGGVSTFLEVKTNVDALAMVAAIMAGSLGWWVFLSHFIGRIRHRLGSRHLVRINTGAGLLLAVFGAVLLGEVILKGGQF